MTYGIAPPMNRDATPFKNSFTACYQPAPENVQSKTVKHPAAPSHQSQNPPPHKYALHAYHADWHRSTRASIALTLQKIPARPTDKSPAPAQSDHSSNHQNAHPEIAL